MEIIELITEQGKMVTHVENDIIFNKDVVRWLVKEYNAHSDSIFHRKGNLKIEDKEIRIITNLE